MDKLLKLVVKLVQVIKEIIKTNHKHMKEYLMSFQMAHDNIQKLI